MPQSFGSINHWLYRIASRCLDNAYQAALGVQQLEITQFDGGIITFDPKQGKIASDYFCTQRDRELAKVRWNLAQFRFSNLFINQQAMRQDEHVARQETTPLESKTTPASPPHLPLPTSAAEIAILEKLAMIETIVAKYRHHADEDLVFWSSTTTTRATPEVPLQEPSQNSDQASPDSTTSDPVIMAVNRPLPRSWRADSLWGGLVRAGNDLTPEYEQRLIQELRQRRQQRRITMQWLTILILIPLLVQMTAKTLIFDPLLGSYSEKYPEKIEIRGEVQESFFQEYNLFKESLEIKQLLGVMPKLTEAETEAKLHAKLIELWRDSREAALNGLKNLLADVTALFAFVGLVYFNRNQLAIVRSYSNWAFLSLADPTKVFIFIFLTDMFVGFHSAEGWEVLLTGAFDHFGLPENSAFIGTFIATVPVFIDSCIKFWIFNYFTRFSPSASAIFERMNA